MNIDHHLVGRACIVTTTSPRHAGRHGIVVGVSGMECEYLHVYLDNSAPADAIPNREMFPRGHLIIQPIIL